MIGRINEPASRVVRKTEEDTTRSRLELLLVGDNLVVESWFVAFEECWTSKDMEAGNAGLALEAELIEGCWVSILVRSIFGRADIEDLNCMSMCMMEEGISKSCIVQVLHC